MTRRDRSPRQFLIPGDAHDNPAQALAPRRVHTSSGEGASLLAYAVRDGSALCLLGGAWAIFRLLSGGELTVAGALFLYLIPGGAVLIGIRQGCTSTSPTGSKCAWTTFVI